MATAPVSTYTPPTSNIAMALWEAYLKSLEQNPLITKSLTSATLNALSDVSAQAIVQRKKDQLDLDLRRTARFALFGLVVTGPLFHAWYQILNKVVGPSLSFPSIMLRIALDRFALTPVFFSLFYAWNSLFTTGKLDAAIKDVATKLAPTIVRSLYLWVPAQYVNFKYVPLNLKVLYGNLVATLWNIYFSKINN